MRVSLPKDALASLPQPDEQGLVRVQATLRVSGDGSVELQDLNGTPVGDSDTDDAAPMPAEDLPNLDQVTDGFA